MLVSDSCQKKNLRFAQLRAKMDKKGLTLKEWEEVGNLAKELNNGNI